jgi:DNA-binding NarL/FixJ family response regulator
MPQVFAVHARESTHLVVTRAVDALPRAQLVGRTCSAVEAARVLDSLRPDAVTVDAQLPDGDGLELVGRLRADHPRLGVVVFGPGDDRRLLLGAVATGASAYLTDDSGVAETAAAIRTSLTGLTSFPSQILAGALRRDWVTALSPRESEVDRLVREGLPTAQIAARLGVSESTVKTHVARVRVKLAMAGTALDVTAAVTGRRTTR